MKMFCFRNLVHNDFHDHIINRPGMGSSERSFENKIKKDSIQIQLRYDSECQFTTQNLGST